MDDLISRQAAIDAIRKIYDSAGILGEKWAVDKCQMAIKDLPSAQPEIIRCHSCKYWTQSTGKMKDCGLGRCDFHDADLVTCNGFCYWAERREE